MTERDEEICKCFLDEAKELLEGVEECILNLENAKSDPAIFDRILRLAHNLKGSAAAVGFDDYSKFTHKLESVLLRLKTGDCTIQAQIVDVLLKCSDFLKTANQLLGQDISKEVRDEILSKRLDAILVCGICKIKRTAPGLMTEICTGACGQVHHPEGVALFEALEEITEKSIVAIPSVSRPKLVASSDDSIRVALHRIDKLMNNVGELVILQTGLSQTRHLLQSEAQLATVNQMDKIIRDVQEITMSLRMIPLGQTFQKMQRIVRDTSHALSKDVDLQISGDDIELDKSVLEQLSDPLVHMLRNAVDHGLETTEQRVAAGKPPKGLVSLAAFHSGGQVVIEIKDDGKGLDPKKLIAKAVEKGVLRADEHLTDEQAYSLIFAPGFSTKEFATDVSGRGVGMDVVKTNITALQGEIAIETVLGKGTTFRISLPLTLAIVEAMVVRLGKQRYVIPIVQVSESIQIEKEQISTVGETGHILRLREENIPVSSLEQILGQSRGAVRPWESVGMIVRDSQQIPRCILVDQIIGQQQVVIKQLGNEVQWLHGVMGAAILGDGEAVLILDIQDLLRTQSKKSKKIPKISVQEPSSHKEAV